MITTEIATNSRPSDVLKKAMHIASYYGFDNVEKIATHQKKYSDYLKQNEIEKSSSLSSVKINAERIKDNTKNLEKSVFDDEIFSALKMAVDCNLLPSERPVLIHHSNIDANNNMLKFELIATGVKNSIAEALILKTASAILEEIGITKNCVYINSIGDKDSALQFARELNLYFRKNINALPAQIRHLIKKDIFSVYNQLNAENHQLLENMPQSMGFLSDNSRRHLGEIIEYLETGGIPYKIDNFLIGNSNYYSQTLFEIRQIRDDEDDDISILAKGGRCDEIVKNMFNINVPAVGIVFEFDKKGVKKRELNLFKKSKKPKFYFVQLGYEAKLKSLLIIDTLRKANIPAYHSLYNDKLASQLAIARYLNVPYTIIMGSREAIDGTIIVKNMNTQFQNTIPVNELVNYIKRIII
ncbi:hypothetical protein COT82_01505 [Candidatus Campbellbacteria bacterium CG10_big_fil_rev_8_21_14_0_10_35_52]|uniref:Anticodon-binding domain-containing protein n=1 Tax=Candidatus Campbellbacteria bacterium CG10_big_fil_rev_8_21_14_0_10_35_52 TaxID=1974527 RepID=A0A2M6WV67_9BACT|nr:MAG: hypothetical protein COT82_01505 [Candidatus Campbellbacteria bacterium CG10_big_fil_rev_8_21_14_0_10_35_52]